VRQQLKRLPIIGETRREAEQARAERDQALAERERARAAEETMRAQRDVAYEERDRALAERDKVLLELDVPRATPSGVAEELRAFTADLQRSRKEAACRQHVGNTIGRYFYQHERTASVAVPFADVKIHSDPVWIPGVLDRKDLSEPEFSCFGSSRTKRAPYWTSARTSATPPPRYGRLAPPRRSCRLSRILGTRFVSTA
jgi:hypothetical protein